MTNIKLFNSMKFFSKQFASISLLSSVLLLSSCVAVIAAGAAAGMMVYDKRSVYMIERDARIFYLLRKEIIQDPKFRDADISVTSFNRVVLLTGQVPSASLKVLAEKKARKTADVYRVYNELTVDSPISYSQHSQDAWISSQTRAKMLQKEGLKSGSIKVVTEDAVVYLMGIVRKNQAALAVDVARRIAGVKKVVKVFVYR